MVGKGGGGVCYVSTAATASKNDVLEGRHFEIVAFRHGYPRRSRLGNTTTTSPIRINNAIYQTEKRAPCTTRRDKMPPADSPLVEKRHAAREVVDILDEIATLLNTNLDRHTLSLCISMVENGVNPEALATVIKELRREAEDGKREFDQAQR
ncbi:hypothetical protein V492_06575 [Pseudogymnoascus sp. VKM F-4246]|nr:hypothetical protein V492_06575 [Pseudogymnoascus sp. VKM F-4246]